MGTPKISPAPAAPPSAQLASFAARLELQQIPAAVIQRAKLHILDGLGLGLASNTYEYGRRAVAGAVALGSGGRCSVLGRAERLEVRDAALVNGILIHGLDFDDTHLASIVHPTCTSLPCALSLGESLEVSGAELLVAFLAGAETAIRIGGAVRGGFHHVGFHATGVVAHFAAAVTASRLLHLSEAQIVAAQGIAGSTASGIQVFLEDGAWTKRFHPGWAAVAGITAARLAQHGFVGPSRPYEGKFGLFETHLHAEAGRVDLSELTAQLGEDWRFGATALKPYPVCHFIHGCADAAIELHQELGSQIGGIQRVEAFLPQPTLHIVAEPAEAKERPTTDYEAKFSAQFVIAACLIRGRFGLPDLQPDALADPHVRSLALRVRCQADPQSAFPTYFSGGVEVTLRDGRKLHRHVRVNSGAGERAMEPDAVAAKFMASATMAIPAPQAERVRDAVMDLERGSVTDLMQLLRSS
ncbi:MAG TPA: MmgE/PrpD family protein [Steroidobacteraceae bacterium]|jgi:2-methylcitrate dehydratase PrpD|nr:MmgE/PrpD family protein [Steroidobacteraceae bacterium]